MILYVLFLILVFRDTSGLLLLLGLDFFAMILPIVHIQILLIYLRVSSIYLIQKTTESAAMKNFSFSYPSLLRCVLQFFLRCVLPLRFQKWIMNRFATLFPFLIRVSPLRWQQVFGTGSAILAAFLALAGAAWSLDFPDVLCFNLFGAIYWLFIYISIYIDIRWSIYERTKEWIKKTWLFRKMKKAFTLERQAIVFILQNGFLITSFGIFLFFFINLCFRK